jgi:hypothetical protein
MSRKVIKLNVVRNERKKEEYKKIKKEFFKRAKECLSFCSDNIGGYALVIWDKDGTAVSTIDVLMGNISRSLVPSFVSDKLNRHIILDNLESEK